MTVGAVSSGRDLFKGTPAPRADDVETGAAGSEPIATGLEPIERKSVDAGRDLFTEQHGRNKQ